MGEKNSSFFIRLEKRRQEKITISCLLINGEECTNQKTISREVFNFYGNIYSSSYSEQHSKFFLKMISSHIIIVDILD